jgi:hypothetical protein
MHYKTFTVFCRTAMLTVDARGCEAGGTSQRGCLCSTTEVASEMCGVDRGGGPLVAASACSLLEPNYRNPSGDSDDPGNRYRQ